MLFLILTCKAILAEDEVLNAMPFDYVNIQYAGNIGMLSVAGGNSFFDGMYDMELYLGITPNTVSEVAIYTLAIKNNFIPYEFKIDDYLVKPYAGVGFFFAWNQRYDPSANEEIPDDYYFQTLWHLSAHFGLIFEKVLHDNYFSKAGFYIETTALDTEIVSYFSSDGTIESRDIFTIALGLRMSF